MMSNSSLNTTYEAVSQGVEYIETNRGFVQRVPLGHVRRFLDLACGNGTVSRLLLEAVPAAHLNGVDLDPVQIDLATQEFTRLGYEVRHGFTITGDLAGGKPVVTLAVGPVDELPFPDASLDCVTIANAIHMLPDKVRFLRAVQRVLKPGGLFGFNSVFYTGSTPAAMQGHFLAWAKEALAYIERLNRQLKAEGKEPIKRVHGKGRRAFENRWYSPQEWSSLLSEAGFSVRDVHERLVMISAEARAAFGSYSGVAETVMSGFPVDVAAQALQATARITLEKMNVPALPRKWLEMWAVRS
jgi:ubiquinone/menaquinone biosynthesis C-methylase UbiE